MGGCGLAARPPQRAQRGQIIAMAAKLIEQRTMSARVKQTAIIMLAVQFDQNIRQGAQNITACAAIIHPCGLAPVLGVDTAQDQFGARGQARLRQNRLNRVIHGQIKYGGYLALFCTLAHQIGTAPPAQDKAKRVKKNGFPRARFPRQNIQPRLKLKAEMINQQKIANFEMPQHRPCPRSVT